MRWCLAVQLGEEKRNMATEIANNKFGCVLLTRFYGGEFRGVCYALSQGQNLVEIPRDEARELAHAILTDIASQPYKPPKAEEI
jgi:hypothetical protein